MKCEIKLKFDWLFWFILLLPTFYLANKDLRHVQMNFFQISIILMIALVHVNKWIGAFIGWALFQLVFFSEAPGKSIILQNICFGGILYHFIVKYATQLKKYCWAFFILLALNVTWCGLQYLQLDPIFTQANPQFQKHFSDLSGFFTLPAFLGNFAAISISLCCFLNPLLGLVAIPALILSKSSFSLLAAGGSMLFFWWFRKRIVFWAMLALMLSLGSIYVVKYDAPSGQFSKRLKLWNLVIKEGFKTQFFGHGLGTYGARYSFIEVTPSGEMIMARNDREAHLFILNEAIKMKKKPVIDYMVGKSTTEVDTLTLKKICQHEAMDFEIWTNPHNEFVQVFFEMGAVGVFIVFGFIGNMFLRFYRAKKSKELITLGASFLAVCVISLGHFPFYVARLAGPCLVVMALFEYFLWREENADAC